MSHALYQMVAQLYTAQNPSVWDRHPARNLADEQVGETVPGPPWLYSRHADAV